MDDDEMGRALGEIFQTLIDDGWELPIHITALASNGLRLLGSYEQTKEGTCDFKTSASYFPLGKGMQLPINVMAVNKEGEAVRVLLSHKGQKIEFTFSEN